MIAILVSIVLIILIVIICKYSTLFLPYAHTPSILKLGIYEVSYVLHVIFGDGLTFKPSPLLFYLQWSLFIIRSLTTYSKEYRSSPWSLYACMHDHLQSATLAII